MECDIGVVQAPVAVVDQNDQQMASLSIDAKAASNAKKIEKGGSAVCSIQ